MKPKTIGGPRLFLKKFANKSDGVKALKQDSKCNFEKRANGLLLHTNYSNKRTLIALPFRDIIEIRIVRGKEEINPTPLYPMWILMKLGVSILKARYFGLSRGQYSIKEMELKLSSINYDFEFIANGFLFERQLQFLQSLKLENRLIVEK